MKWGDDIPEKNDLSKLRLLGSVGESINPEAYVWYRETIGAGKTPVVDTWWQTETGSIMISPLPGVTAGEARLGDEVDPRHRHRRGRPRRASPCPTGPAASWWSRSRGPRCCARSGATTSGSRTPTGRASRSTGYYFAGDGAKKDDDGDIWLLGRVDDVMNVSGHRLSTTEIESALVSHPKVAEAAVVGAADETTGQAVCAFVILKESALEDGEEAPDSLIQELRQHVQKEIGAIAKPRQVMVVPELPKTRSGKIMRRLLKDVAENREVGDVTTLADSTVMDLIGKGMKDTQATTTEPTASARRHSEPETALRRFSASCRGCLRDLRMAVRRPAVQLGADQVGHQVGAGPRTSWSAIWPSTTVACTEATPRLCSSGYGAGDAEDLLGLLAGPLGTAG